MPVGPRSRPTIVLWNTVYLERAPNALDAHQAINADLLQHLSPLGWQHINPNPATRCVAECLVELGERDGHAFT